MGEPEKIPNYPDAIRMPMTDGGMSRRSAEQMAREDAAKRFAAIVFCPCCVTAQDVEAEVGKQHVLDCVGCGQRWSLVIDKERQAANSVN